MKTKNVKGGTIMISIVAINVLTKIGVSKMSPGLKETLQFLTGIVFMVTAFFGVDTGTISEGLILQLLDLIFLIIGSAFGGVAVTNFVTRTLSK